MFWLVIVIPHKLYSPSAYNCEESFIRIVRSACFMSGDESVDRCSSLSAGKDDETCHWLHPLTLSPLSLQKYPTKHRLSHTLSGTLSGTLSHSSLFDRTSSMFNHYWCIDVNKSTQKLKSVCHTSRHKEQCNIPYKHHRQCTTTCNCLQNQSGPCKHN